MDRAAATRSKALRASWDTRLELRLAEPEAAHVLNTATVFRLARHEQHELSRSSLERWIHDALASGRLVKVVRGLYLNRMTTPPESVLNAGKDADRLADVTGYLRARPEAALLHWLYLGASPHSNLSAPPLDIDMDELNARRLTRLAKAMNLADELTQWMTVKQSHDQSPSVMEKTWIR